MFKRTDDLRITEVRPLIPPAILLEELPITERVSNIVSDARQAIANALKGTDRRLVVIAGPCSIHDTKAALDYAGRLMKLAERYKDNLIVVMRLARQLLLDVNNLGLPTASEFLDTQIPQHIADLTSWVAIGARTTESQVHRELASGLSMPVGFKNSTDGNVQTAVDAVVAARSPHWFPSVTKQGVSAIFQTTGNDSCHVILRGGTRTGPNYDADHVGKVCARLAAKGLRETVMVDCSHGNSLKDHVKQADVAASICEQIASGSWQIFGAMLESHLVEGRQDYTPGQHAMYGQSITDACLSLAQTEPLLEQFANAQQKRGASSDRT